MKTDENKITIENVTKTYGKFKALNNINLEIKEGMFGLLGHNGAGKTTLMKLITALTEPTKGRIIINGFDTKKNKMEIKNIIGFLPQEFSVYPDLTAYEFLDYIAKLNNIRDKNKRSKLIESILNKVNLLHVRDKKIGGFSGGMKRRIGIAQAVIKDPKVLIVDEPTAGLDPEERIRFRTMLVELSQNKIVILSTHIVEDISASCEQIALLDRGTLSYTGTPINFVNKVEGKVWEICTESRKELIDIKNKYSIISMKQTQQGIRVRVLGENLKENSRIKKAVPNLEDGYIYFMENKKEVRKLFRNLFTVAGEEFNRIRKSFLFWVGVILVVFMPLIVNNPIQAGCLCTANSVAYYVFRTTCDLSVIPIVLFINYIFFYDDKTEMNSVIFTQPIESKSYVLGKFLAVFLMYLFLVFLKYVFSFLFLFILKQHRIHQFLF
ncbi:ATP-binding cassette domain-containing protein (plasmid) [Haloimpatiens sp. FM7330]|uniref:ATP-binding cassette domain-containing protein n=1 Tax=Haloimpatiens sp. FM7330 TaxID=3298610 RepID=UPI0036319792